MPFITNSLQNRNRRLIEASIGGRTDNTVSENTYNRKPDFRERQLAEAHAPSPRSLRPIGPGRREPTGYYALGL
jgi:hypothetical protein